MKPIEMDIEVGADVFMPTTEEVEAIEIGVLAPDAFGRIRRVERIFGRGTDIHGRAYVCYHTDFGNGSTMSNGLTAGVVLRSVALCNRMNSAEIDKLEGVLLCALTA